MATVLATPEPRMQVLSFDIGIRNLAWCLMKKTETNYTILGWQNYDLLRGEGNETAVAKVTCHSCSAKAIYQHGTQSSCVRHCPAAFPPLRDLSGGLLKKMPSMAIAKEILAKHSITGANTKVKVEEKLATQYSLPVKVVKVKKAVDTELTILHDAIRKFVIDHKDLFRTATHILLENQPVLKNPTMKSVQILLFATLRDVLQPAPPQLLLVHAGKKVKVDAKGDEGYKDRKQASEAKVRKVIEEKVVDKVTWATFFASHAKKNDLADAFCMCVDKLG
jgi:hypothetical protein